VGIGCAGLQHQHTWRDANIKG